ncbi:MAG: T9SS type A sorting domain-containing protein [Ignavibacteriales bacterium]
MQNYPNPFNPGTVISYQLPVFSHVRLAVYDVLGREIAVLFEGDRAAGIYSYHLNANEHSLTSGVYFYRLSADGQVMETRKMVLLK